MNGRKAFVTNAQTPHKPLVQVVGRKTILEGIAYKSPYPFLATMSYRRVDICLL